MKERRFHRWKCMSNPPAGPAVQDTRRGGRWAVGRVALTQRGSLVRPKSWRPVRRPKAPKNESAASCESARGHMPHAHRRSATFVLAAVATVALDEANFTQAAPECRCVLRPT